MEDETDFEEIYFDATVMREAFDHLARGETAIARILFERLFDDAAVISDDFRLAIEEVFRLWPRTRLAA